MSDRPFSAHPVPAGTMSTDPALLPSGDEIRLRMASVGKRLLGAIVDVIFTNVLLGPGFVVMFAGGAFQAFDRNPALILAGSVLFIVGFFASIVIQMMVMKNRSQSIGKYLMKTQVVDYQSGMPARFTQVFWIRSFLNTVVSLLFCVGLLYAIVDACFIYSSQHRCLHDLIAGTIVIDLE